MADTSSGGRDLVGYGANPPAVPWPNGARLAVSVVVNYEEGSEYSQAMGDATQEGLTEFGNYPLPEGYRNLAMESMFEYGSRAGVWRILRLFDETGIKSTFYACAVAFEQNPEVARAVVAGGHEVCSHGYRWEEVFRLSRGGGARAHPACGRVLRAHLRQAAAGLVLPLRPLGPHPRAGGGGRRLPLRFGRLQRRSALLRRRRGASATWSCPIRRTATTSASGRRRVSSPPITSTSISETASIRSTRSPRPVRR